MRLELIRISTGQKGPEQQERFLVIVERFGGIAGVARCENSADRLAALLPRAHLRNKKACLIANVAAADHKIDQSSLAVDRADGSLIGFLL